MVNSLIELNEVLDRFADTLVNSGEYSEHTTRAILSDVNCLKNQVANSHFPEGGLESGLCLKLLMLFIDSGKSYNTKARRYFTSQKICEYFFKKNIFEYDILDGYCLQDIISSEMPAKGRYEHAGDILHDKVIEDLLDNAWSMFTKNFNPQNYLLVSLLLSGVKINSVNKMEWHHVTNDKGDIELVVEGKRIPLSRRVEEDKFIDCLEYYKGNGNQRLFEMSIAGLVQRVYAMGDVVGQDNLSSMNFRWTCLHDLMQKGLQNGEIAEVYGVSENYLNRIEWE